jgi:hypothetical protein
MTTDKSSSPDQQDEAFAKRAAGESDTPSAKGDHVPNDLKRIASYLTENRATQSTRNQDLAEEIARHRVETTQHAALHSGQASTHRDLADEDDPEEAPFERRIVADGNITPLTPNPILAEKLDTFCRELDFMLEKFRARVEYRNSVKH